MTWEHERIGDILVKNNVITSQQLTEALDAQKTSGKPLGETLVEIRATTEEEIAKALAKQKNLPVVSLDEYEINSHAVSLITERIARRHMALPIGYEEGKLVLAMANPLDIHAIDDLRVMTGYEIKPVVCTSSEINSAINKFLARSSSVEEAVEAAEGREAIKEETAKDIASDAPVVKLVNQIIGDAIGQGASDIHIEPQEKDFHVRFRVDGVLHEIMTVPKKVQASLISRFKIMSGMNIAEHRMPQDGRAAVSAGGKEVDLRVATLPTIYGENVTLRILDKSQACLELKDLGFSPDTLEEYKKAYSKAYGALLVTGPTGSGKSTTIYSTLNVINSPKKKIITVEDPVEYRLPGILQIQVNPSAGLSFAAGLRSILRCDPDIIMVGEIRDLETAKIAIESALTGHLMLSTLHTNDAPSALTRLIEMGLEPFLVSSSIDCVLAQRLARKLCKHCKEEYKLPEKTAKEIGLGNKEMSIYRAKGCKKCLDTGYKGRVGVYEVMPVSSSIAKLCVEKKSTEEIREVAIKEGMRTLREDGLEKVKQGITSLEEIMRVVV
ncbi:ATPase, T2SS/T4P/T4SS family [Candidatus Oleimmundimicrobium sp.]|uniref:GspE/PulE family protein n=1 Tax=Candidatus Oleimmundimicrobium sp. TaxID=3060597 RepID=UPI0027177239|nr:ATPase, T2SS/T4P/T4SS family [Candidatus Oleimmundimicrobium sp.]MDO8885643.1 ATPase, T2SS/T4P/T4SS family [Candidatus Oleimmundimicrobium sp.]